MRLEQLRRVARQYGMRRFGVRVCAPGSTLSDAECVWCGTTSDVSRMTAEASKTEVDMLQYVAVGMCVLLG